MSTLKVGPLAVLVVLCTLASNAPVYGDITTSITVPNFSFENYHTAGNSYANQTPNNNPGPTGILFDDWVTTSNNYQLPQEPVSNFGATPGTAQGTYYMDESIPFGTVVTAETENPVATIDNNATYNLTVALGLLPGQTPPGQIEIQLLSGANLLAHFDATSTMLSADGALGTFTDYSASFSTLLGNDSGYVGQNLSIAIVTSPDTAFVDADIDNVRLNETTVPEPSTWAMMMLGAGGLLFLARRKLNA